MKNESHIDQPRHPINSQAIFAALRNALAALYPKEEDARVVVDDAGLPAANISFCARAQTNWHNILAEAVRQERVEPLLYFALSPYSVNPALLAAYAQYRLLIDQDGHLEATDQLPASGATIAGDMNLSRLLLRQEIDYNVNCLKQVRERVGDEQVKYNRTFKRDEMGGWYAEGDPIHALMDFHPSVLNWTIWEGKTASVAASLAPKELTDVMNFYGCLKVASAYQERFLSHMGSKSDPATFLVAAGRIMNDVLIKVTLAIDARPELSND